MKFSVDYYFRGHASVEVEISEDDIAKILEEECGIKAIGTEDGIIFIDENGDEIDVSDYVRDIQERILNEAEAIDIDKDDVFYNAEFTPYSIYYGGHDYYID